MNLLARYWDRWKRRRFGGYSVDDPRPIAKNAPYTFFLPSENECLALQPGDLAKILFRGDPPGRNYEVERMWVLITHASGVCLTGTLENTPFELHQIRPGDVVKFTRDDVIDFRWAESRAKPLPSRPPFREYWDRCMVDRCILDDGVPIYFLYREEPDLARPDDAYPDSGWRIRGDYRALSDDEFDARKQDYVAMGKVLNADDSWLHLIDAPTGSAFLRDEQGQFAPADGPTED